MDRRPAASPLRQDVESCPEGRSPATDTPVVALQDQGPFPVHHHCTVTRSVARLADRFCFLRAVSVLCVTTAIDQGMQTVDRRPRVVRLSSSGSPRNVAKHDSNSNVRLDKTARSLITPLSEPLFVMSLTACCLISTNCSVCLPDMCGVQHHTFV